MRSLPLALAAAMMQLPAGASGEGPPQMPARLDLWHLPAAIRVSEQVISGGQPAGEQAFAELARLGVKTVLSVDGARPDVAAAARHGLRYVHLPHGYDGIPADRLKELAKAVRELDGLVYIHCHHGKHRSPAAAGAACVAAGLATPRQALDVLAMAGTSPHYLGLFRAVRDASPLDPQELAQLEVDFRAIVRPPPLVEAMVELERAHDRMQRVAAAGWRAPADHPDLDPAHEALLMREHFAEMMRLEEVEQQPAEFLELLRGSQHAAVQLHAALLSKSAGSWDAPQRALADCAAATIAAGCTTCHRSFRDASQGASRQ